MTNKTNTVGEQIGEILEEYATYCYYEGDPKRGGTDRPESVKKLRALFNQYAEEYVKEKEGKNE